MQANRVADWMSIPPILAAPTTTLAEAQRIMEQRSDLFRLLLVEARE